MLVKLRFEFVASEEVTLVPPAVVAESIVVITLFRPALLFGWTLLRSAEPAR